MNYATSDMEDVGNSLGRTINFLKKKYGKTKVYSLIGTTIFISSIFYYKIIVSIL